MADIELVIKIPEEEYKCVQITGCIGNKTCISNAIYNATPLSKGHGRLIDADELNKYIVDRITMPYVPINKIEDAPTIIEADES